MGRSHYFGFTACRMGFTNSRLTDRIEGFHLSLPSPILITDLSVYSDGRSECQHGTGFALNVTIRKKLSCNLQKISRGHSLLSVEEWPSAILPANTWCDPICAHANLQYRGKRGDIRHWSDDKSIILTSQYIQPPFGTSLLPHIQWTGFCVQQMLNGQVCELTLPSNISSTTVQHSLNANTNCILMGHVADI